MTFADPARFERAEPHPMTDAPDRASLRRAARSDDVYPSRSARPSLHRTAAGLLLVQFACMWGAFFVLAPAIDWPASLGLPASAMLPLLLERFGAVFTGYALYLVHALTLVPLAVVLAAALRMGPTLGRVAIALGVLAGAAKALGIVRWLFLMPALATAYVAPEASEATRDAISVVFDAFNAYAGGVGELLGVGLFAGMWTVLLSLALLRLDGAARWIGFAGLPAALLLFSTLPSVLGIESPVLLTVSGIAWQFWTLALAVWLWRSARAATPNGEMVR